MIDPVNVAPISFFILISFGCSFHVLFRFWEAKLIIFLIFPLQWTIPVFEAAILPYKQKVWIFEMSPMSPIDLHDKSFICTKFQAFTTFSVISSQ